MPNLAGTHLFVPKAGRVPAKFDFQFGFSLALKFDFRFAPRWLPSPNLASTLECSLTPISSRFGIWLRILLGGGFGEVM
jgi:hypothetical protein